MAEDKSPPGRDLDKRIADLEEKAKPQLAGLSDRVTGAVWDNIKDFFTLLWVGRMEDNIEFMPEMIDTITSKTADDTTDHKRITSISQLIDVMAEESDPAAIVKFYERLLEDHPILEWGIHIIIFLSGFAQVMLAETSASKELFWQTTWKRTRPALIPMESLIAYAFKNQELTDEVKTELEKYGYRDDSIAQLFGAATEKLPPDQARDAFLRGLINEFALEDHLKAARFGDSAIEVMKQLYELIPPVGDLITMAVREAFTPEIAARFGQYEDFPPQFEEWAAKQGLTQEWAQRYWAAHWNLPSANQGFEMLHRDVIGQDELNLLLRALDVMPFWRDALTKIAYNPLTRVDVRRMYALGVLDEEGVKRSYLDIGYDDEKADLMTQFTVAYTTEREKELTKTDIISLFKRSVMDFSEATALLMELGYSELNASLLVQRATFEMVDDIKKKKIEAARKLYVAGRIKEQTVYDRLGKLDMPAEEQNALLDLWEIERDSKVRYFTVDQIKAFFAGKVLNEPRTLEELQEIGYSATDAGLFLQLWKGG